ncbi:hypothetical protein FOZ61_007959 [Perkinsus olseni]|uniref:DUF2817 domain-containing protein n=1 Tax=Perkinsus olseni TaxID=32597 RepID=A0A7J6LF90_PEROL|nr:hypothetical protein FOZ61_007959 [Perkinsus olseni]KAF4657938.1 hypothetical protein FOL46_007167 [Perkinsus olseni]
MYLAGLLLRNPGRGTNSHAGGSALYYVARTKFRTLATQAGLELKSFEVVPASGYGDEYIMDGYGGSGIQCYLLDQIRQAREEGRLKKIDKTLVFVHAVNPYGMAHYRRFNEENVELNRNALEPHEFDYLVNEREEAIPNTRNIHGLQIRPLGPHIQPPKDDRANACL